MSDQEEVFISVDVEAAGPFPGKYSLLAIGACRVDDPSICFYAELKPTSEEYTSEAISISQLSIEKLKEDGQAPEKVMRDFGQWIEQQLSKDQQAIFVAFNAPFDWMFINDYFHRYLNRNPFGYSAIDMKAFYMGMRNSDWSETSMNNVAMQYADSKQLTHNALQDSQDQARIFQAMLQEASTSQELKGSK